MTHAINLIKKKKSKIIIFFIVYRQFIKCTGVNNTLR